MGINEVILIFMVLNVCVMFIFIGKIHENNKLIKKDKQFLENYFSNFETKIHKATSFLYESVINLTTQLDGSYFKIEKNQQLLQKFITMTETLELQLSKIDTQISEDSNEILSNITEQISLQQSIQKQLFSQNQVLSEMNKYAKLLAIKEENIQRLNKTNRVLEKKLNEKRIFGVINGQ